MKKKRNIKSVYYHHATADRNTSYPFISGDTYRAFADFIFDETRQDNLKSVRYGDSIFVKADMLDQFFDTPYESIQNPFVLITHNSEYYSPRHFKTKLNDEKIIVWYAANPDIRSHPKLISIPIGLANTRWPQGNLMAIMHAFRNHRKPWANRTTLLYVNFNLKTNREQRQIAVAQAEKIRNVQIISKSITFETYLQNVGNAKFVLSPPGNGFDCHRTWEALLLGAAPVVLSSGLNPLYEQLPAVVVDDWTQMTENLLLSHKFSSMDDLTPRVLYARYWLEKILKHRDRSS